MDAVISGRVGKALLLEGDALQSFDVDDPGTLVPMRPSDYRLLFGDAPDLQFLEDTDAGAVARALEFEHNCACALDVALISLDPELSTELRTEAVDALEELVREEQVLARLENILYAEPLPPAADVRGAIKCCEANNATVVRGMFEILEHHQQAIREVKLTWDAIPLSTFEDEQNREQSKRLAIHEGLFRSLVLARGSQPSIDRFRPGVMFNPSVQKLQHSDEVLQQLFAQFLVHVNDNVQMLAIEIDDEEETYPARHSRGPENIKRQKKFKVKTSSITVGNHPSQLGLMSIVSRIKSSIRWQKLTELVPLLLIEILYLLILLILRTNGIFNTSGDYTSGYFPTFYKN